MNTSQFAGQREDVIQRQRRDDRVLAEPRLRCRSTRAACSTFATMLRCVSIAPLATPVVPPVYCRNAMSS